MGLMNYKMNLKYLDNQKSDNKTIKIQIALFRRLILLISCLLSYYILIK